MLDNLLSTTFLTKRIIEMIITQAQYFYKKKQRSCESVSE